jgi:hypothetical protein
METYEKKLKYKNIEYTLFSQEESNNLFRCGIKCGAIGESRSVTTWNIGDIMPTLNQMEKNLKQHIQQNYSKFNQIMLSNGFEQKF